jgi:hypothetical protein
LSGQDNTAQQRRALYKFRAGQYSTAEDSTGKGRTIQYSRGTIQYNAADEWT